MRFEERELNSFATFVPARDLKEGAIYFVLHYLDDRMLLPIMRPVVFIGKNLEPGDTVECIFKMLSRI
jgi:hypothetical protein